VRPVASALIVGGVLLGSCTSSVGPESDLRPEIVRVGPGLWSGQTDGPFQIQVVFDPDDGCGSGIIFTVDEGTLILDSRARAGQPIPAGQDILVVGARVSVAYTMVNQSCPGQSRAISVERLH
jgi:hypothetical protein